MLTASIANPYMVIVVAVVLIATLLLRWYYLKTVRDIKKLEALGQHDISNYYYYDPCHRS